MGVLLRKGLAELLGTLIFVFSIIGALNAETYAPLVIGIALMVMVYATGHISGGHLNPAVSFGAYLRGAINAKELLVYIVSQLIGGALGAFLSLDLWEAPEGPMKFDLVPAFVAELVFTFALVFVVLNTATSKDHPTNSFYGLAIGTTVFVGAATVGGISGGSFNPAVAFGLSISGQFDWAFFWLYVLAPLVGAAIAALAFRVLNPHDLAKTAAKTAKAPAKKK